ncbi:MAG: AAA family ATPase [Candidatus Poribacteria bacterium]|nr:AAA family ATPase [Candidatus Poribacteria bacterium]
MKICRLKLKNLNSFREEIDIDFEGSLLGGASLVAITGPTGAGKTTLLDAICVALYGKTPRLSGTGSQNPSHLISHGEKEGSAEVYFVANGTRYIATWSINRRGPAKVQLSYAADGKLISDKLSTRGKSLGSSQKTVSEEVESILGLDFGAFRRSVMLAQGEFAAFLKASKEDRRTILEATAGISIYDVLKDKLNERVAEVEAAHADVLAEIGKIPEASPEQLVEAETKLDRLKNETDVLEKRSQDVQQEKDRETKRTADYKKLQSSEEHQAELLGIQPDIDTLRVELEDAQRAERLRPEKQTYDTAKSDLKEAEEALAVAATEKTDAEKQVASDQADFDEKETVYQTASTVHEKKTALYNAAKLDVQRAADQFVEADKRTSELADLADKIDTLSNQLTSREAEQAELQKQVKGAQTFLDENRLPSDRQHRLNRANVLSAQLDPQQEQLETALKGEVAHSEKVSLLKREIKELSETRAERHLEKTVAEATLESANAELNRLQAAGTQDEWNARKQQAVEGQPIAQKYETATDDLTDSKNRLRELNKEKSGRDTELEQIEAKLVNQTKVCQHAEKAVEHCKEARELALLANPINQLRQRLQPGEPCQVCGSTDHSFFHIAESVDDDLLRNAKKALEHANTELQTAKDQIQILKTKQTETQRDKDNTANQIENSKSEVETLLTKRAKFLVEWQEIYPGTDVSSGWATGRIEKADTAIAELRDTEQAYTKASHAYDMVAQQLATCETDITREERSLNQAEKQLQDAKNILAGLQADIASTEERFWEFLPEIFHGIAPDVAVDRFSKKIEAVATREDELSSGAAKLDLLNAKIESDQNNLENLQQDCDGLQDEIDEYRREGEAFLDAVREKTNGLETKDEIDAAIDALVADLQAKETERDEAEKRLQNSRNLLTEKQTTHGIAERYHKVSGEKFQTAQNAYFDKLSDAGFDSPQAHDSAFRDETQMQNLTDQIDAHENKKQQLALDITELRARFEETPFDPEALERIETEVENIAEQLQTKQQEVGAQQQRIDDLKDALQRRETLGDVHREAQQELERWQRLYEVMPRNELRDFALEIMFKQMGGLANLQLDYLTSERYQLKVESIGDLTVIDRWNANEERPVETLSGGESFLTSLALALALADLSRGRAQLHSLFLDEGFGTLDTETLDTAIAALEGLRMQGRSIFLISHVQELTRRIPVKINVRKHGNGSSSVDIRG